MAYSLQPVPRPKGPPEINVAIPPPPPRPVELVDPEVAKASMTGKVGVMGPPPKDPPPAKASEEVPESSLARPKTKPKLGLVFFPDTTKEVAWPCQVGSKSALNKYILSWFLQFTMLKQCIKFHQVSWPNLQRFLNMFVCVLGFMQVIEIQFHLSSVGPVQCERCC